MCANTSYGLEPERFLESLPPIVRSLHLVALLIMTAAILVLNGMVIFVAWKNRKLDADAMANNAALATLDIAWAMLINPIGFFAVASRSWPFGQIFCAVTGSLTLTVILLRNQLVGLAVLDKFCSVFAPFKYPSHRRRFMASLAVAAIVFAIAYPVPPALNRAAGKYSFYSAYATCFLDVSCTESGCYGYLAVIATHWVICWAILPTVLISAMCMKARAMATNVPVMGTFAANVTANTDTTSRRPSRKISRNSCDTVQGSVARPDLRNGSKLQTTFILHVVIYVGCFLPLAIHFSTYRIGCSDVAPLSELSATLGLICGDIGILLAVLDPLVTLTNKNACGRSSVLLDLWRLLLDCDDPRPAPHV